MGDPKSLSRQAAAPEPPRAVSLLRNPYHGTEEFGGRPEWAHTWFHGTRGEPEFGVRRKFSDEAQRAALPPEQRKMNSGWSQPNQHLGVHFTPLHEVAHKFVGSVSSTPGSLVHAQLGFSNPAVFDSEEHLNIAMAHWASQHYPHWHDEKLNGRMAWNYGDNEGTHRDFSQLPDNHRDRYRLHQKAQDLLTWHPHMPEILRGFTQDLRDRGHHGLIYGNGLEGPYETDAGRGGEAAMKYIKKREDWPRGHPYSFSAIAHPDDIRITHVEHIAPWREEPQGDQRTWEDASDNDEPDEMRDKILDWHRQHGGKLPFRLASAYRPSSGIFAPTTGLDPRLFEDGALRPQVTEAIMERIDRCIRVDVQLAGSDWQEWMRVYLAGGSASEWAGNRPNEQAQDLDVLVGIDLKKAQGYSSFEGMDEQQAAAALNAAFRHAFNETGAVLPGVEGTWDLTAYCNPGAYDIRDIKPYAAWDLTDSRWAVKPPHLPEHSLADFDPAVLAHARAVLAEARAILRMPEPLRSREAKDLWEHIHAHRCTAFSPEGHGWQDIGNVDEKWLAYAPGNVLGKIRELALPPKTANRGPEEDDDGVPHHFHHQDLPGQYFHGTNQVLAPGDRIEPGHDPVYPGQSDPTEVYFAEDPRHAMDYARKAVDRKGAGEPHVYRVEAESPRYDRYDERGFYSEHPLHVLHEVDAEGQQKTAALEGPVDDEGYPKYYYHVSPHRLPMGTQLRPGVHMRGNFDESTGTHVHMTDDIDRAEQYRYLLWEQGHPEQHMYEVRPHGPVESDPADSQAVRTHHPVTVEGTMDPEVDESDWFHPKTASREDQLAAMDPRTRASALAQEHVRMMNPRTTFPLDADQAFRPNKTMVRWLQRTGVPRAEESYVAKHPDPSRRTSNSGRGPDGEPMVVLHPDRWDYGTMAHETAHLAADHETGRQLGAAYGEHGPHDDRWAGHYAGFLNDISPGAGDEFLEQRSGHLGLSAEGSAEKPTKTKGQVNYRKGTAAEHCGNCVMIRLLPPDFESAHCTLVKGLIDPDDVCDEWSPEHPTKTASSLEPAADAPTDVAGPWYHGSGKRYREGDIIDPAVPHRRIHPQSDPGKAYFSDSAWNAQNWANVASPSGKGHVYEVEPTGDYEEDPHYSGPEERGIYDLSVSPIKRINVYQTGHPLRVVRRMGSTHEAASGYEGLTDKSAMIYLEIPEGLVRQVPGGVDDHHITLVYLGKNVSDEAFAEACRRAREAAARSRPLSGVLRGVDTFPPSDSSDNKVPAFVPAYIPGIGKLRQLLEDLSASEHRHYKPHVTLGYYAPDEDLPEPHPPVKVRFSRLHVKRGGQVVSFALGSPD